MSSEKDVYRLDFKPPALKAIASEQSPAAVINIPLDPQRSVLTPPEDRIFGKYNYLAQDTGYLVIPAALIIGLLYVAPEDISGWDDADRDYSLGDLGEKWWDNVSQGPVWDQDDWWLNWIGHPYWGATYYLHARHYAYNKWESFLYSVFVSDILFEYGVEAFTEKPSIQDLITTSIQDLITTPIGGWLLGEFVFLPVEAKIISNGDRLLGSKVLGKATRIVLDPIGSIIRPLRGFKQKIFGLAPAQNTQGAGLAPLEAYPLIGDGLVGIQIRVPLW